MSRVRIVLVGIGTAVGLLFAEGAWAQGDSLFNANGFQLNRDYVSPTSFGPGLNATEHVDPVSGSLILTFTDLVLPGNGGRDLVFQRTYNSKGGFGGDVGRWSFGIAGVPLWVEDTWPGTPDFQPVLHTADGGGGFAATNLNAPAQGQAIRMTDRFWKYYRNSRIAWMPDGTVVNFDTNLRLSSVVDPFGNTILSLAYSASSETVTVTQSLGAGQERVITVELPTDCVMGKPACVPTSMSYAGRIWTYTGGGYQLSMVTPPVGPPWQYEYGGDPSMQTMRTITPNGGSVLYTIQNLGFPWTNGDTYYTNVLTARQASDVRGGQSSGTWSFDYEWATASLAKSSVVTAPDGTRNRYNYGFWPGLIENNGAALYSGRLYLVTARKTWQDVTEPACNQALECETRQYGWLPIPSAAVETLPALTNRAIIRGGRTYSTTYSYSSNNYGDFHNPSTISESGDLSRTIVRTYAHSANAPINAPYIIARLTGENVTVDGQTFTRSWGYDLATGFNTSETIHGIQTTFTGDGRGNVASATRANGESTSFTYSNGRVSRVTTPGVVTDMQINPDGTVASTSVAGRVAGFEYDDVGRQLTAEANGKYAVMNAYDNVSGAFVTTSRGPSSVTTWVDGFGRPVDTLDAVNVRTNIQYDAAGRTTYQSLPYVAGQGAGNVGTHYIYDGLGRIRAETFATGHSRTYGYLGNVVRVRDEEGRTTQIVRSGFGHPDDALVTSVTDADNKTWTYTYNAVGSLRTMSGSGVTRTWQYDNQNRLVSETHPESGTTTYPLYDAAGVLKRMVDANGTVTNYGHDGNDRLTSIQAGTEVTTIGYENGSDNRVSMSVSGGASTAFHYDATGNMTRRTDAVDGKEFVTEFIYDPSGILRVFHHAVCLRCAWQPAERKRNDVRVSPRKCGLAPDRHSYEYIVTCEIVVRPRRTPSVHGRDSGPQGPLCMDAETR